MVQVTAMIVAAGRGERIGGDIPKQYRRVGPRSLLGHAMRAFVEHAAVDRVIVVIHPDDRDRYDAEVQCVGGGKMLPPALGGRTRQESVHAGLTAVAQTSDSDGIVLVHDAARPFVPADMVERAIAAANAHGAAVPVLPVSDTVKQVDAAGLVVGTPDRAALRAVQTPQSFRLSTLLTAHSAAIAAAREGFTDDASIVEWSGGTVATFAGDPALMKVTMPDDLDRAAAHLGGAARELRVATGYDVHALGPGDHVWLGGVRIPHEQSLIGHSDADPVLHAITDALLGAIGDGDIGVHFPPSDPQWKGAASHLFLADAARRVRERGGRIVHLDASIVCEAPRIGPHREAMRQAIASAAGVSLDRVGLKATTSERLGFTGRGEGIAALATATVELPAHD